MKVSNANDTNTDLLHLFTIFPFLRIILLLTAVSSLLGWLLKSWSDGS
jgi:hypothetical protein